MYMKTFYVYDYDYYFIYIYIYDQLKHYFKFK